MPIFAEWRDVGVPVLYTCFPPVMEAESFRAISQEALGLIEARGLPFVRLLDVGRARVPVREIAALLEAIQHPAFRHPLRRALLIVVQAGPDRPHVATILHERLPGTLLFETLEEAEAWLRREGPALIDGGSRDGL